MSSYVCIICGYIGTSTDQQHWGTVRGNTERFKDIIFHLWKCPQCQTIHSIDPVDFRDIYADYPLNKRRLDTFARGTLHNLLKRLRFAGMKKSDLILDYGCGNGIFVQFLRQKGYSLASGYDPYVPEYAELPENKLFDCIITNDVIEHVADPRVIIKNCVNYLKKGGLLYIGTADSEGVEMNDLEPHIMRLHQPFHRIIITQDTLRMLSKETGLELIREYRRSYMDTLVPFVNYRFLNEFSKELEHNLDRALEPSSGKVLLRSPRILFYAFFGYFFPSAYEPAVVMRKPK
jgi:2-polyprenyl-3-methyl-5-hydroxy-6-metoxy-1,4-benzoquinol methylase